MKNWRADVLAIGALMLFGFCISALFFLPFPAGAKDVLLVVIGALIAIIKDVYGFEFGSSKGSERNAQATADALKEIKGVD